MQGRRRLPARACLLLSALLGGQAAIPTPPPTPSPTPTPPPTPSPTAACHIYVRGLPRKSSLFAGLRYNLTVEVYDPQNVKKVVVDAQLGYCAQGCSNPCRKSDIGPFDNKTNTGKYLSKEFSFVAGPTKKESEECDIVFSQATTVPPCTMAVSNHKTKLLHLLTMISLFAGLFQ